MRFDAAQKLVSMLLEHGKQQNAYLLEAQATLTSQDFDEARMMIGKVMGCIYLDALHPLFCQHPTLEPEELIAGRVGQR